jgi:hypothetical protein
MYTTLEWVALGIWVFVIIVFVYGIIAIHDIPASVARKRNHPHVDAIEAAGWVSLFMLHALWPFLWIWAFYYRPELEEQKQSQIQKLEADMDSIRIALSAMQLAQTGGRPNDIGAGNPTATQDSGKEA